MSVGNVSGGGGGLPLEVLQMMNELGREVRNSSRAAADAAADLALQKGYEEADELREQAEDMRDGALLNAGFTATGAVLQGAGAATMSTNLDVIKGTNNGINELPKAIGELGGTVNRAGGIANDAEQAAGKVHESDARRASADAQAANRRAESEKSDADEAQKVMDRGREAYSQIISLEHASIMAAIGGRA